MRNLNQVTSKKRPEDDTAGPPITPPAGDSELSDDSMKKRNLREFLETRGLDGAMTLEKEILLLYALRTYGTCFFDVVYDRTWKILRGLGRNIDIDETMTRLIDEKKLVVFCITLCVDITDDGLRSVPKEIVQSLTGNDVLTRKDGGFPVY
jgi:hypothetical protein